LCVCPALQTVVTQEPLIRKHRAALRAEQATLTKLQARLELTEACSCSTSDLRSQADFELRVNRLEDDVTIGGAAGGSGSAGSAGDAKSKS
jgi:hypothetical protein